MVPSEVRALAQRSSQGTGIAEVNQAAAQSLKDQSVCLGRAMASFRVAA